MNKYIKAFVNVSVLAQHSEYYNRDRDEQDIKTINELVNKASQMKPKISYDRLVCPRCRNILYGYSWYECATGEPLIVKTSHNSNYCEYCGQRLGCDVEEKETE